ncbi:GNAT family N-acetyltransferase [Parasediminibacterium sp. JCM 36343]|uniref:GNAT family N-acetyltransferase n=1 Tax=Parasediminibacterium sp. JCM 36343 TaxID=3374279 RepID=UPI0039795206
MDSRTIIKATKADGLAIHELIASVLGASGLYHLRPTFVDDDINDLEANYFSQKGYFWVLKNDAGGLTASVAIGRIDDTTCELRKMYLLVQEQGKGIGKLLLQTAIAKAKELGYAAMILKTNSQLGTAIGLYKKYGFQPVQISEKDKKADCDVAMRLDL